MNVVVVVVVVVNGSVVNVTRESSLSLPATRVGQDVGRTFTSTIISSTTTTTTTFTFTFTTTDTLVTDGGWVSCPERERIRLGNTDVLDRLSTGGPLAVNPL
ncbi:hypothetical protein [Sorangium sp. So ce117]|uniref:hypothetical protein n=1 Tax=Sorangium sp. So ce117 TaxID=3133277 RepID=UPI003F60BFFF